MLLVSSIPLKTLENLRFSDVLRGCRKRSVAWYGLNSSADWNLSISSIYYVIDCEFLTFTYQRCSQDPIKHPRWRSFAKTTAFSQLTLQRFSIVKFPIYLIDISLIFFLLKHFVAASNFCCWLCEIFPGISLI